MQTVLLDRKLAKTTTFTISTQAQIVHSCGLYAIFKESCDGRAQDAQNSGYNVVKFVHCLHNQRLHVHL